MPNGVCVPNTRWLKASTCYISLSCTLHSNSCHQWCFGRVVAGPTLKCFIQTQNMDMALAAFLWQKTRVSPTKAELPVFGSGALTTVLDPTSCMVPCCDSAPRFQCFSFRPPGLVELARGFLVVGLTMYSFLPSLVLICLNYIIISTLLKARRQRQKYATLFKDETYKTTGQLMRRCCWPRNPQTAVLFVTLCSFSNRRLFGWNLATEDFFISIQN